MRVIPSILALALVAATPLHAMHRGMTQEDLDYPGTIAIATGHGEVDVRVIYQAQEDCWRIKSAREGVPNRMTDQPSERHLYVTVDIEKTAVSCQPKHNEITTRLTIPDKPGRISLDVFFVDERGVYQRSQRHRIQRD
jgi:hypothetical protein